MVVAATSRPNHAPPLPPPRRRKKHENEETHATGRAAPVTAVLGAVVVDGRCPSLPPIQKSRMDRAAASKPRKRRTTATAATTPFSSGVWRKLRLLTSPATQTASEAGRRRWGRRLRLQQQQHRRKFHWKTSVAAKTRRPKAPISSGGDTQRRWCRFRSRSCTSPWRGTGATPRRPLSFDGVVVRSGRD
jgi:hypothetical protein